MKLRPSVVLLLCIVLCSLCTWLWLRFRSTEVSNLPPSKEKLETAVGPAVASPGVGDVSPAKNPVFIDRQKHKENAITEAFLTPISIFGKVVDEAARPIADATVEIAINDHPMRSATEYTRSTNSAGLFSLTGTHGISFSVRAFKRGFYATKESTAYRNVIAPASADVRMPSEEVPLILTLRSQGKLEKLIHVRSRQIDISPSGETAVIDLTTGRVGTGQLHVTSRLSDSTLPRFDWRFQISIPEGGLAERGGQFIFEAPQDGYSRNMEISMSERQPEWTSDVSKQYFAKLPDGRFARFAINFYPGKRNFVVIESHVNPTPGNRNLEAVAVDDVPGSTAQPFHH